MKWSHMGNAHISFYLRRVVADKVKTNKEEAHDAPDIMLTTHLIYPLSEGQRVNRRNKKRQEDRDPSWFFVSFRFY